MPGAYATQSLDEIVEACKQPGDADAWDEFLQRTHRQIAATVGSTLRRWGRYNTEPLDDVVQDVYLKISANGAVLLRNFQPSHPNAILGYLRAIAVSVASDYCRMTMTQKRGANQDTSLGEIDPPDRRDHAGGAEGIERGILLRQIDEILTQQGTTARDRSIFWLYYRQGLTASSISLIPGLQLSTKGVESIVHRLTRILRVELGTAGFGARDAQFRSAKDIGSEKSL